MGHQKKVASSGGSSKGQKSSKKGIVQNPGNLKSSPVNSNKQNNSSTGAAGTTGTGHEDEKDTSASSSNRYKNYAGISGRSVRCYWEQFNNHETECQDEVYMRVAEDVTYKLWELGNALKVYSRHTGGRVTTDLVNVVLKDMNVAPVLGANSSNWDTVDSCCDPDQDESAIAESFYFNSDRVVDLRDEYMKEYQMLQPGPTSVTSTWCVEDEVSEDLLDLFDRLGDAIFLGDEETFVAALEVADSHPFVCGIISLLLNRCTEMLAFDYKKGTLERTMKFLIALTGNSYLDQNHMNLELYYLSQLMINLLLGADNDKYFEQPGKESEPQQEQGSGTEGQSFAQELALDSLMDYASNTVEGVEMVQVKEEVEPLVIKKELPDDMGLFNGVEATTVVPSIPVSVPIPELKHDYEALFIMMDNGEFGMKKLEETQYQIKAEPTEFVVSDEVVPPVKQEEETEEERTEDEAESEVAEEEEMCVITTKMCDTEEVALVCQCMGRLAGFWSYMYRECSYLLLRRIDQFFLSGVILLKCEYEWLVRAIQAVFALGEVPFREFSTYVDKLHVTITPDWVTVQLNCCGVFLRDQQDAELYDVLYELCGDALLPFMLYRFMILKHLAATSVRSRVVKYRIVSKVVPKLLGSEWTRKRTQRNNSREPQSLPPRGESDSLDSWFEDRTRHKVVTGKTPRIGFKFAGCRPMTGRETRQPVEEQRCNGMNRSRIIVATRKLLRPLSNVQSVSRVYDLSSLHF